MLLDNDTMDIRMRDRQGRPHSFWEARARQIQYSTTNLGLKVAGWALVGGAAGIGLRTLWNTLYEGKYSGNIANQLWDGLQEATPFINNNDFTTDITTTLSAGMIGGLCYLGGKFLWGKEGAYGAGQDYNNVAVEVATQTAVKRDQRRAEKEARSRLEEGSEYSGGRVGDSGAL